MWGRLLDAKASVAAGMMTASEKAGPSSAKAKSALKAKLGYQHIVTSVWPLWGTSAPCAGQDEGGVQHVSLVWVQHTVEDPMSISIRVDEEEVRRLRYEKATSHGLPAEETINFTVHGRPASLVVTSGGKKYWLSSQQTYTYALIIDGAQLEQESVGAKAGCFGEVRRLKDPLATALLPPDCATLGEITQSDLLGIVCIPEFRVVTNTDEAREGEEPTTTVEYRIITNAVRRDPPAGGSTGDVDTGSTSWHKPVNFQAWHRYSAFANMHADICANMSPEDAKTVCAPPPKSWTSSSPTADDALHARRQALQTYMHTLLRAPAVHATRNPYVLQLLGVMPAVKTTLEKNMADCTAPSLDELAKQFDKSAAAARSSGAGPEPVHGEADVPFDFSIDSGEEEPTVDAGAPAVPTDEPPPIPTAEPPTTGGGGGDEWL